MNRSGFRICPDTSICCINKFNNHICTYKKKVVQYHARETQISLQGPQFETTMTCLTLQWQILRPLSSQMSRHTASHGKSHPSVVRDPAPTASGTKSLLSCSRSRSRIQPHGSSLHKSRLKVMRNEEHIGTHILTIDVYAACTRMNVL